MRVFVITYCQNLELLYGSRLVFDSIRVGFPNAQLSVIDNASLFKAREELKRAAASVEASYRQLEREYPHASVIADLIASTPGPVAILDGDLCFWEEVNLDLGDCLMAGRYIPQFSDPFSKCMTAARLHTSFLVVPNSRRLLERVTELRRKHIDFDPFRPYSFSDNGTWRRFDTGASLYAACPDEMHAFTERELDCYDHIYCGSHLPLVLPSMPEEVARLWQQAHDDAKSGNVQALRGIYRAQQQMFEAA